MNSEDAGINELRTLDRDLEIDRISDRYEAAWRSGERPDLSQYLDAMPKADSRHLFRELFAIEVSYRRDSGETLSAEEFLRTYPQYMDLIAEAIAVTEDSACEIEILPLPAEIGKYRVIGRLGLGGQAEVYRVVHPTLHHEMVLKLAKKHAFHGAEAGLLEAEGRLLAALKHPNLAQIYDLGYHEGRPYLVIEYIRGCNLRQHVRHTLPHWKQSARWVAELARAVAAAHAVGVIHRDIKPDNVVIDGDGEPHLIDFGLAVVCDAWMETALEPGAIAGSACYMAPEQAKGDATAISPALDVFSLGSLLYFLLTGLAPYEAASLANVIDCAAACDFDRSRLRFTPVPGRLVAVCLKAMERDPRMRFQSAEELASELDSVDVTSSHRRSRRLVLIVGAVAALFASAILIDRAAFHTVLSPHASLGTSSTENSRGANPISAGIAETDALPVHGRPSATPTRPQWDKDTRELRIDGRVVRRVKRAKFATNIVPILDAFEAQEWPPAIASPFPEPNASRRLKDAVTSLNEGLTEIRFYASTDEMHVCWRSAPANGKSP